MGSSPHNHTRTICLQHRLPPPTWAQISRLRPPPPKNPSPVASAYLRRRNAMNACYFQHRTTPKKNAPLWSISTSNAWPDTATRYNPDGRQTYGNVMSGNNVQHERHMDGVEH